MWKVGCDFPLFTYVNGEECNSSLNKNAARSMKNCLRKTCGETSDFYGSHGQNTAAEYNQTLCYWVWQSDNIIKSSRVLLYY
jgi:hypothetical protein